MRPTTWVSKPGAKRPTSGEARGSSVTERQLLRFHRVARTTQPLVPELMYPGSHVHTGRSVQPSRPYQATRSHATLSLMDNLTGTPKAIGRGADRPPRLTQLSWLAGLIACGCLSIAGCGSITKTAPTQQDVVAIGAAVSDIVYQCQSVATGFTAGPDVSALRRDVDTLLNVSQRVRPDARFVPGSASGVTSTTNLRQEISLATQNLTLAACAPAQAKRLATVRL
jgi:hypothetical protein